MAGVGVVTDSTSSLAPEVADRAGVRVVPLQVVIDGLSRAEDDIEMTARAVAQAQRSGSAVTTSRPTPEAFARAYGELAEAGATSVVSVHLSGRISGTVDAARRASQAAGIPVTVVDTRCAAMAVGFAALAGAHRAREVDDAEAVVAAVQACAAESSTWFCVDDLDALRRGGRIGAAQSVLGSVLSVKPLLTVEAGVISPYERVRTAARAVARLQELAERATAELERSGRPAVIAVHHVDDPVDAEALAARIGAATGRSVLVSELSSVLAVHVGAGTLGVVVAPG